MALLIGFGLVAFLGIFHHFALLKLRKVTADAKEHPNRAIITVFIGLLVIHLAEILLFAGAYRVLLSWPWLGQLHEADMSWTGLIYFSGINFTSLGYTQIEAAGPLRLINMMQSLGGFMILTWSATFSYSIWSKALDGL
ncbi:ion channel [Paracoccus sp. WLY502]|uniref:ion channel n=1 Tax=Paracoccus yibinensis TaxID=3068891 RepID=UPI002796AF3A|nr:ion channel [Paracoccus sp. WLY502]MDQ1902892.1 ion channel [Paracoccus sp. WLY502]